MTTRPGPIRFSVGANPLTAKGLGALDLVRTAAIDTVYHATRIRVRDLPIIFDKLVR